MQNQMPDDPQVLTHSLPLLYYLVPSIMCHCDYLAECKCFGVLRLD